ENGSMAARTAELDEMLQRQEREAAPLHDEIERLRAQRQELADANNDLARENNRLIADARDLASEINRLTTEVATRDARLDGAGADLGSLERAIAEEARRHEETRDHLQSLSASAARLATELRGSKPAEMPKSVVPQALERYPDDERDEDARTLAEVKASLLAELDNTPEPEQAPDREPEMAENGHIGDRTLAARIRALEAGVTPQ
ncbi:MAG: hypothetical protein Q7U42_10960, partial [Parvibaculum sp.]|nr:hypothetical protein [Parvibaculum sp.]